MSARLPSLKAVKVIRTLERAGLVVMRVKGSHHIMEHPDGADFVRKIIEGAALTLEEFRDLL